MSRIAFLKRLNKSGKNLTMFNLDDMNIGIPFVLFTYLKYFTVF